MIDFGSTYTKVVAVDLDREEIAAQTRVPSTVDTDITIGLKEAFGRVATQLKTDHLDADRILACSSAAGGLRIVCVGFVPEYTSQAANLAALGAGAKVVGRFSYQLDEREVEQIEALAPDILLLTGGTNGGNTKVIIHNAEMLAKTGSTVSNVIVAGNKAANRDIKNIFNSHKRVTFCPNVMPEIGKLDLAPCNAEIRDLFMNRIIEAKGIAKARSLIKDVIMPTPAAVLEAAKLIARGVGDLPGFGELIVVDTGGATTNVHSIASGNPQRPDIITAGLPEPYEKRTVEGDLGLKYNLDTIVEILKSKGLTTCNVAAVKSFAAGKLPQTAEEIACHRLLTKLVIETAVNRHAGRIEETYGPTGRMFIQHGKDLTGVGCLIGTGGAMAFSTRPEELLKAGLYSEINAASLKPKHPQFWLDEKYILYAVGLLSQSEPEKAFILAKKYLKRIG
ncbi:MAG TPA: methylaspartate mutase accessory protein GlmL [Dehalococcoidales bacterium]